MATKKIKEEKARLKALAELASEAEFIDREVQEEREEALQRPMSFGILDQDPESELAPRLQQARESKGYTQGQLSERTKLADKEGKGLSRAVISLYELGTNRPGPREMRLLCEALRVTPSYLIYGDDDPFNNHTELVRYGGVARSEPEFYAYLTYCFSRLHKHHRIAFMDLMLGLLRGWNKGFDEDLHANATDKFLEVADDLRLVLAKRRDKK